jgi:hypothetical protein
MLVHVEAAMSGVLSPASITRSSPSSICCCVFPQTGTKVKASDKFSFPLALDLGALVSPTAGEHLNTCVLPTWHGFAA